LVRGVEEPVPSVAEGTPRALIPPALLGVFNHRNCIGDPPRSFPYNGDSLNYVMADNGTVGIYGKMVKFPVRNKIKSNSRYPEVEEKSRRSGCPLSALPFLHSHPVL
jgi:hypothetical protein